MRGSVQFYVELDLGERDVQSEAVYDDVRHDVHLGVQELKSLGY